MAFGWGWMLGLWVGLVNLSDAPVSLKTLHWKHRVVLYFPAEENRWIEPSKELTQEFQERKLLYWVYAKKVNSNSKYVLLDKEISRLRQQYAKNLSEDLWILIGLDGGVKAHGQSELNWETIFKLVDGMPMRRSEIQKNG